jgi:hypothetical protein
MACYMLRLLDKHCIAVQRTGQYVVKARLVLNGNDFLQFGCKRLTLHRLNAGDLKLQLLYVT